MERLTGKNGLKCVGSTICRSVCATAALRNCPELQTAIDHLTAYEDTGLFPEDIVELKGLLKLLVKFIPKECNTCKHWFNASTHMDCKVGGCLSLLKRENWQWQHADRLETVRGGVND